MTRKLIFLGAAGAVILAAAGFFLSGNAGTKALWELSDGGRFLLPLVGVSALIDSINPCAFSVLILTIAFLFSIGNSRTGILRIGGAYIAGIFAVYLLIGLGIVQVLHLFNTPHFMAKLGATLLIALGAINLANELFPSFPIKLRIPSFAHRRMATLMGQASLGAAFALGALVGLCEFPCTGGPYLMVLGLLHDRATYLRGVGYLLLYNLIFILPLAIMLLIASNRELLARVQAWQRDERKGMRLWGGVAMVALGIAIFFL
ncbi:MAG: hypothetical protein A3A44_02035 [Candidatus Sungbacteria bacterium RIFCSPLOWO2_01_FULL_60_25]|uniref:Uncharacterized protein n=1 Tax=Candidatus Sungbacteria bacterium RIFCSPLOWO2_01_FULL_60_25 TaxID=1802281 RepID=A0A1G2LDR7_9BACT|nr:MAG: hypothetical protein A3A44_02035 [Candidatus Sungbacteria bacterium RIFCSPLOWO2_01_FULL_60_25]